MTRRRWFALIMGFVIMAGIAAGCGSSTDSTGSTASKDPIKLGFLVPITTENALLGKSLVNGVNLAVDEVNATGGIGGRKIDLMTSDIGNNNTQAINALQETLAKNPVAIIGHIWSTMMVAQHEIVKQKGIPFFYSAASVNLSKMGNPWLFRITTNDGVMAVAAAEYVVDKLGKKKIGILYSNEEYGIAGRDIMVQTLKSKGITPVAIEAHGAADKDVSAQLLNLKKAGADIILGWSFPVPTALTVRQLKELKIDIPYLGGRSMALTAVLGLAKGNELDGTYGAVDSVVSVDPNAAEFVKKYQQKFKQTPDFAAAAYYDLVYMLKRWIEQNGTKPDDIRKAVLATQGYKGIGNVYSFKPDGESVNRAVIMQYKGSDPEILQSVEVKN